MSYITITMIAYQDHNLEIVKKVLSGSIAQEMLFPLEFRRTKSRREPYTLANAAEFDLSLLLEELDYGDPYLSEYPSFTLNNRDRGLSLKFGFNLEPTQSTTQKSQVLMLSLADREIVDGSIGLATVRPLVEEFISTFMVKYAYASDAQAIKTLGRAKHFKLPQGFTCNVRLGWISFFGKEYVNYIGRDRFNRLETCFEKLDVNDGILIVLQEEPFQYANEKHRVREAQAIAELGLEDFLDDQED